MSELDEDPGRIAVPAGVADHPLAPSDDDIVPDVIHLVDDEDEDIDDIDDHELSDDYISAGKLDEAPTRRRGRPAANPTHRRNRAQELRDRQAPEDAAKQAAMRAKQQVLAAKALEVLTAAGKPMYPRDIARAIDVALMGVTSVMQGLVNSRQVIRRSFNGRTTYSIPQPGEIHPGPAVKTIAVPPFDRVTFLEAIARVFESGVAYDLAGLVRETRGRFPQSDSELVTLAVRELLEQQRIERVMLGSFERFRKVQPAAASA